MKGEIMRMVKIVLASLCLMVPIVIAASQTSTTIKPIDKTKKTITKTKKPAAKPVAAKPAAKKPAAKPAIKPAAKKPAAKPTGITAKAAYSPIAKTWTTISKKDPKITIKKNQSTLLNLIDKQKKQVKEAEQKTFDSMVNKLIKNTQLEALIRKAPKKTEPSKKPTEEPRKTITEEKKPITKPEKTIEKEPTPPEMPPRPEITSPPAPPPLPSFKPIEPKPITKKPAASEVGPKPPAGEKEGLLEQIQKGYTFKSKEEREGL